jgi:hypothetical protein
MPKRVEMSYLNVLPLHLPGRADRNEDKLNLAAVMVRAVNKGLTYSRRPLIMIISGKLWAVVLNVSEVGTFS